jgi:predicted nucleic acid-binding protein
MNHGFVVDSSVAIAWVVSSQSNKVTDRLLEDVASGQAFAVPVLWAFEVANTLVMLERRRRLSPEEAANARSLLRGLVPVVDHDGNGLALREISELAQKHSLSAYDATYLELALRLRMPLASRDAALNKAARLCGADTLL